MSMGVDWREFEEKGYVVLKKFFTRREMKAVEPAFAETIARRPLPEALNRDHMYFYSRIHRENPKLGRFVSHQKIVDLLQPLTGPNIWVRWDQCVHKAPGSAEFGWHQDAAYTGLAEPYYLLWIAISRVTPERGGLRLAPGSHKRGLLPHDVDGHHIVYRGPPVEPQEIDAEVGDAVLFSSYMLHSTLPNISSFDRWTYVIEYISTEVTEKNNAAPYFVAAVDGRSTSAFMDYLPRKAK